MELSIGMKHKFQELVTPERLATSQCSGGLEVYATPSLIRLIENACYTCVEDKLDPGQTTVGAEVCVKHLSPTPNFIMVSAECELTEINGRELVFNVSAFDEFGKIAEGTHKRFIVDSKKFMAKAEHKASL